MNTITSLTHPLVKHLVRLKNDKKYRLSEQLVLLEGKKVIEEVAAKIAPKLLLTTNPHLTSTATTYLVTPGILEKISNCQQPEDTLAVFPLPHFGERPLSGKKWLLALDRVRDPGNLGTLMRSALAFGWQGIFLLDGCCDPYNDKALRAARGASFFLPTQQGSFSDLQALASEEKLPLLVADLDGSAPKEQEEGLILLLGNESSGPIEEAKSTYSTVTIPMGDIDSLNVAVAGSILMYVLKGPKI
ncbi:MAG: hypothetical protein K0S07_1475 [Chlamydiales bacterium]|jgi:TrmH family RNA methyltransferase|nr:hypothetical protein [Chlamydiales bacterium]